MKRAPLWLLAVTTSAEAEEAVGELLQRLTASPVSVYANEETKVSTVTAYCPSRDKWTAATQRALRLELRQLTNVGLNVGPGRITFQKLRVENWAESWKKHFKPIAIGAELLIKPANWTKSSVSRARSMHQE